MQIKVGVQAPHFEGIDQFGKKISLDTIKEDYIALYFYPKDNTPSCTTQACNLRDNLSDLKKHKVKVIGVSGDNERSHSRFTEKYALTFSLLADTSKKIIHDYSIWGEKKFMGRIFDGIHRRTFVIGKDRTIIGIITKPKTKNHAEEILEIIKNN